MQRSHEAFRCSHLCWGWADLPESWLISLTHKHTHTHTHNNNCSSRIYHECGISQKAFFNHMEVKRLKRYHHIMLEVALHACNMLCFLCMCRCLHRIFYFFSSSGDKQNNRCCSGLVSHLFFSFPLWFLLGH